VRSKMEGWLKLIVYGRGVCPRIRPAYVSAPLDLQPRFAATWIAVIVILSALVWPFWKSEIATNGCTVYFCATSQWTKTAMFCFFLHYLSRLNINNLVRSSGIADYCLLDDIYLDDTTSSSLSAHIHRVLLVSCFQMQGNYQQWIWKYFYIMCFYVINECNMLC